MILLGSYLFLVYCDRVTGALCKLTDRNPEMFSADELIIYTNFKRIHSQLATLASSFSPRKIAAVVFNKDRCYVTPLPVKLSCVFLSRNLPKCLNNYPNFENIVFMNYTVESYLHVIYLIY